MNGRLIPTPSEHEWLEARRTGITASEIAVVMGLSPWSSPYALYHRKRGTLPEQDETDAMALGKHMESFVAAKFAERHPEFYITSDGRALYAHQDRPWQMATPDRLVHEDGTGHLRVPPAVAVLECKIDGGSDEWGEDGSDTIPVHYRCQLLWQMDVLGVTTGYVACLLWNRRKVRIYELTLDGDAETDLKIMRDTAQCFLDDIKASRAPEPDWRPATTTALKALHPSVEDRDAHIGRQLEISYRAALRRYKEAEQRKRLLENRLREVMGAARRAVAARTYGQNGDRVVIATRQVYYVREHTRKASTVDKLVPAKPSPKEEPTP